MRTVPQAFHSMITDLELRQEESEAASHWSNELRCRLREKIPIERDFLAGSFIRNTKIRPLDDIDMVVVLGHQRPDDPRTGFEQVRAALARIYPYEPVEIQSRCVSVRLSSVGIGFDVLPAYGADHLLWIYRGAEESWIRTAPEYYHEEGNEACARSGNKLKPLIKVAKHWNRREGKPLRSFHLEVMAYRGLPSPPRSYAEGLAQLFLKLAQLVQVACPPPGSIGPAIDDRMTPAERRHAQDRLERAAEMARQALVHEEEGRVDEAHHLWRSLLGDIYPEAGRQAVDDSKRRFG